MIRKFAFILLNIVLATNFLSAQQTQKATVYFDSNKYELTEVSTETLQKSFEKINNDLLVRVTLIGHTDWDGSEINNQTLSQNRAKSVLNFLMTKSIPNDKVKIEFYGERKPIAKNDNEQGKQQNRRVEIIIEKKDILIADIFSKFSQEIQKFKVKANQEITIKGKDGTIINIPKNSLCKQNGEIVKGEVEIELKEYYKKSDIVVANLHTMSDDKILETAGMIYISASFFGEKLKMKKGNEMKIEFASKNKIKGMETFIGEQQNNQINWVQQNNGSKAVINAERIDSIVVEKDVYEGYENDTIAIKELNKVDKMILKTAKLGWINCDRFYNFKNKTNLIIEMDTAYKPIVRLVFKDINSIMPGHYTKDKKIILNDIPVGQEATIIAFSLVNEEPYFISKDIVISKDQKENLELIKTTMIALEQDLKKLN